MLEQPYARQGLKRALRSRSFKTVVFRVNVNPKGTISLEPDAIPLDQKIVLLG